MKSLRVPPRELAESAEVADADYQIEELLGEGGMGAVYAARQKSMDRPVAIKVLKPRAARLASSQDAFVSEAVITGKLDHPNIVPIYDVGKQPNDALFYAMKQVEGVEWKERFADEHGVRESGHSAAGCGCDRVCSRARDHSSRSETSEHHAGAIR